LAALFYIFLLCRHVQTAPRAPNSSVDFHISFWVPEVFPGFVREPAAERFQCPDRTPITVSRAGMDEFVLRCCT
jgi:hypothetical protein